MKFLSIFLVFIFLLSCTTSAQEKANPLAGTTWKLISGKWATEDTTVTFPNSPYHQQILIYGKTHFNLVSQDTSRDYSFSCSATYTIDGDNYTATYNMFSNYVGLGKTFNLKFQIDPWEQWLIIKFILFEKGGYHHENFYQKHSHSTVYNFAYFNPTIGSRMV
jgi:hypothetical protein